MRRWVWALGLVFGCSSEDGGLRQEEQGTPDAGPPDAGPPIITDDPPILSRPITGDGACTSGQVTNLAPRSWWNPALEVIGDAVLFARRETLYYDDPAIPGYSDLRVSRVETGTIAEPIYRQEDDAVGRLARQGASVLLATARQGAIDLRRLDPLGTMMAVATLPLSKSASSLALAAHDDNAAVAWYGETRTRERTDGEFAFQLVGRAEATVIETSDTILYETSVLLLAVQDGYAMLWQTEREIHLAMFDERGDVFRSPTKLADRTRAERGLFTSHTLSGLPFAQGALVAWVESYWNGKNYSYHIMQRPSAVDDPEGEAWAVIRIAQLDRTGAIIKTARLAAPMLHVDMVDPQLVRFGDRMALTWSEGEHIYQCSGCFPNHKLRVVLIDPETLSPISEVAEATIPLGGLMRTVSAFGGNTLISASTVQYHTEDDAALVTFTCQ